MSTVEAFDLEKTRCLLDVFDLEDLLWLIKGKYVYCPRTLLFEFGLGSEKILKILK